MNRFFHALIALLAAVFAASAQTVPAQTPSAVQTASQSPVHSPQPEPKYAGDAACQSCHKDKVETFHHTSHYLTSTLPDATSILGKFSVDANVMKTSNPDLFFRMEATQNGFFQTAVVGSAPFITTRRERFAFVIGSGEKGQTYLFWKGDDLFQLPVSYWTELGWVNSPGYRDGEANFGRPVIPRCLECHATYFEQRSPPPNRYRKDGFVLGITCEKCHGPGGEHVKHFAAKPAPNAASGVLNPAHFTRERQMDLCAWCHAGIGSLLQPEFSYVPGGPLAKYLKLSLPDPTAPLDVHGSQAEMLERSRCFQKSEMTCLTCHDVHTVQHEIAAFSRQCLSCHKPETPMFPKQDHATASDCIGCHMPLQDTNLIVFDQNGKKAKPKIRSHWIKVY